MPRRGEKFWPSPERVAVLRERGEQVADFVQRQGYDVIGDVDDLRTPAELPNRRHPESVTDTEMLPAATATIAAMMTDLRRATQEAEQAKRAGARGPAAGAGTLGRLRQRAARAARAGRRIVRRGADRG